MKRLCFSSILAIFLFEMTLFAKSAVIYYGKDVSWLMLGVHEYIILEPHHVDTETYGFHLYRDRIYAYVSVGEIDKHRAYRKKVQQKWIKGTNTKWNNPLLDLSNPQYRKFLLNTVFSRLEQQGYKNFFLDTVDSYLHFSDDKEREAQLHGMVSLIWEIHQRFPRAKLILNRGFEIFDDVKEIVEAIAFESYYQGLDEKGDYVAVREDQRLWLRDRLEKVREANVTIIAIDYLSNPRGEDAKQLSIKLQKEGFVPYVADRTLSQHGTSSRKVKIHEIIMLCDMFHNDDVLFSNIYRYASLPLEHMRGTPMTSLENVLRHHQYITGKYFNKNDNAYYSFKYISLKAYKALFLLEGIKQNVGQKINRR